MTISVPTEKGKTMREKLIELIREVQYLGGLEEKVADHLIANGVTIPVRCKGCKHFDKLFKGVGVINKIGTCYLRKAEGIETAQSCDDFCSCGERRTDNE